MNIMKQAIAVKAKAYAKMPPEHREKARKRAAQLRIEIDAASQKARRDLATER